MANEKVPCGSRYVVAAVTWLLRLAVGAVFIFSGFVKGIDPWGTFYKIDDYLRVMHISLWSNLELVAVFCLFTLEFCIGVLMVLGCFRRTVTWACAAVMVVMLPLTLWIAVADPVADCGCFGDAFIISNWATFWKNVALMAAVLWLVRYNRCERWVVTPALQWLALISTVAYVCIIGVIGYLYQPLIDFRPFKIGMELAGVSSGGTGPEMVFIYEKDGVKKEFREIDELPDEADGWTFIDRRELPAEKVDATELEHDFRIWSADGDEDVTEDVLVASGGQLLLMMPRLSDVSIATTWKINSLYSWAGRHGIDMFAVVAGNESDIANWQDLSMSSYPVYTSDDTSIKEVVRGNPAVVYLQDGKILWKSSLAAIDVDDFLAPGTSSDPSSFATDSERTLRNCSLLYITVIATLIVLSFIPYVKDMIFGHGVRRNRDGEEHDSE